MSERADRGRREEEADRRRAREHLLRHLRKERRRHAEDHRDRVDDEEAEHDVLASEIAEAVDDRPDRRRAPRRARAAPGGMPKISARTTAIPTNATPYVQVSPIQAISTPAIAGPTTRPRLL